MAGTVISCCTDTIGSTAQQPSLGDDRFDELRHVAGTVETR